MDLFTVYAHEVGEAAETVASSLGDTIRGNSIKFTLIASLLLLFLLILVYFFKEKNEMLKKLLFWGMILVIFANTLYLAASTIYLNTKSLTGGPVHYHADFEIWNCGKEVTVRKPQGLSNKTGTELVHSHNDNKIHIEGVIEDSHELTLGHFFENIGGKLGDGELIVPTDNGVVGLKDGDKCVDGSLGHLQVFVYQTKDKIYFQKKLDDFQNHQISPYTQVPPGDCIILEFGPQKIETEKLCKSYQVAKEMGKIYGR